MRGNDLLVLERRCRDKLEVSTCGGPLGDREAAVGLEEVITS
jgi:hypothetical protein